MAIYLHSLLSGKGLELHVRRHSRTNKISMRFAHEIIRLTVPKYLTVSKMNAFLKEHDQWLEDVLHSMQELLDTSNLQLPSELKSATSLPYLGEMVPFTVKLAKEPKLGYSDGKLTFWVTPILLVGSSHLRAELMRLLQLHLIDIIEPLVEEWTEHFGVKHTGIKFSRAKKRWGSCTSVGKLRFNWRLIFTPRFVIESIVIHEVCHLVELNHSPAFRALEHSCNPRVHESDQWLREQGWTVLTFDL